MNCLRKSSFLCNFKMHQRIPDCNYSRDKWSTWTFVINFQSYLRSCEYLHLAQSYHLWESTILMDLPHKAILCDVQKHSLISRLKLITQELVSRLFIVALTFLPNILGVSFLGPILKRVMCYSEPYCDRVEKFWFLSLCSSQFKQAKPPPATQP